MLADQVKQTVPPLESMWGVAEVWHEDRELVVVRGRLPAWMIWLRLYLYWARVVRKPPSWAAMTVVERALDAELVPGGFLRRKQAWSRPTDGNLILIVALEQVALRSRKAVELKVGVLCPEVYTALWSGSVRKAVTLGITDLSWTAPAGPADRPIDDFGIDTWPFDEGVEAAAAAVVERLRTAYLPTLTGILTPVDALNLRGDRESARCYLFNSFDEVGYLVLTGRQDEAQTLLQKLADDPRLSNELCVKLSRAFDLPLARTSG